MNIIIPLGGIGSRFSEDGYRMPKPLVNVLGKPILFWNLENLKTKEDDKIFIIYKEEQLEKFNFCEIIKHKFPNKNIFFVKLLIDTRGAAETVLYGINNSFNFDLEETTLVVDGDNFFIDNIVEFCKKEKQNLIFYFEDFSSKPIYSYIEKDEFGNVFNIKEKYKISNFACSGAYCFKNGNILKETILKSLNENLKDGKEFYISKLYKIIIENGQKVNSKKVDFVCLGTPQHLKAFASNLNFENKKNRFCFDLDGTIVTFPLKYGDYSSVLPIDKTINFIRFLFSQGHEIIIHTARRMKTFDGNVGKVIKDISKITIDTLEKFNVPYHELVFGKPYADFYIDDLAIRPNEDLEKETGFYDIHPEPRSNNKIIIHEKFIEKFSDNISGEKYFYLNIPEEINHFFPSIISHGSNYIRLEKINGIPLSYLNINKTLNKNILLKLFNSIEEIHNSKIVDNLNIDIYENYSQKFIKRIKTLNINSQLVEEINNELLFYSHNNLGKIGVIHGDPVLTNVILDIRNDNLKFIDMRGKIGENLTIFGDIFYDYAKIYQSLIGYDFILMNKEVDFSYTNLNKKIFKDFFMNKFHDFDFKYLQYITKSLILSMLPLHPVKKQNAFQNLINNI